MNKTLGAALLAGATIFGIGAETAQAQLGFAGLLSRTNREDLPAITLASGKPVAEQSYNLISGKYYRVKLVADGSAELALSGGDFFRAIWINEIVINKIEIRPMGVHSIEFDAAGEALISFVAVVPGTYHLSIPGSSGESQRATFVITGQ